MANRKTRRGGAIGTFLKKQVYGESRPEFKLPITESTEFDSDKYEILGTLIHETAGFSFIRSQSYIEQYLKADFIEKAMKQFPKATKIICFDINHIKTKTAIVPIHKIDYKKVRIPLSEAPTANGIPIMYLETTPEKYFITGTILREKSQSRK